MKTKIPGIAMLFVGALLFIGGAPLGRAQSTQEMFEEAKKAYYRGDLELAKAGLEAVISIDPRHTTARAYLGRIQHQIKEQGAKGGNNLEAQMTALIIPSIDFKEATLGSIIEFLPAKAAELTEKKFEPSIIFKGDPEELERKKVTLKLTNVPMSEVLRYVGDLTEVKFVYDKYAVVATPVRDVPAVAEPEKKEETSVTKGGTDPFGGKTTPDPFR
jgi:hypothetical protein